MPLSRRGVPRRESSYVVNSIYSIQERSSALATIDEAAEPGSVPMSSTSKTAKLRENFLSKLLSAAEDIRKHLTVNEEHDEAWKAELEAYRNVSERFRKVYYDEDDDEDTPRLIIGTETIMKSLGCKAGSQLAQRVARAVAATNIAVILDEVWLVEGDNVISLLKDLDAAFPRDYLVEPGTGAITQGTFELALDIRTHLFVAAALKHEAHGLAPLDAAKLLADYFCDSTDSSARTARKGYQKNLIEGPYKWLAGQDTNQPGSETRSDYETRIIEILNIVESDNEPLRPLLKAYPKDALFNSLKDWAESTFERIYELESDVANPTSSQPAPSRRTGKSVAFDEGFKAESQSQAESDNEPIIRMPAGKPRTSLLGTKGAVELFKKMERGGVLPSKPPSESESDMDESEQDMTESESAISDYSQVQNLAIIRQAGRMIDPGPQIHTLAIIRRADRMRDAGPPSDDGQRREDHPPLAKRAKVINLTGEGSMGPPPLPSSSVPARSQPPAPPPFSSAGSELQAHTGSSFEPDIVAVRQRARTMSAAARLPKLPKSRTKWSNSDELTLIRACNTYHCKWSRMEAEAMSGTIPFELPRPQQALRDKARMLKMEFLKADANLPAGFDLIAISQKERDAIKALGRNPYRQEKDVDRDHNPINTVYHGFD